MNKQKYFTEKINDLILHAKSQGVSTKDISDKWHTFGDLYYHRMILTLALMRQNKDKAWKSKQHHDGTMFEDSFICGIDTRFRAVLFRMVSKLVFVFLLPNHLTNSFLILYQNCFF